jgi:hypothetical protein
MLRPIQEEDGSEPTTPEIMINPASPEENGKEEILSVPKLMDPPKGRWATVRSHVGVSVPVLEPVAPTSNAKDRWKSAANAFSRNLPTIEVEADHKYGYINESVQTEDGYSGRCDLCIK